MAYNSPYFYMNSQYPTSGMTPSNNVGWNTQTMSAMGIGMPGQMNIPSYENPNYNNLKR